jgi:protein O-mannosyl-transferase
MISLNPSSTNPFRILPAPVWVCLLLAIATLAIYLPVGSCGFIDYDDDVYFFANPHVLGGLNWADIKWAFTSGEDANWHPLTWLSLMLDAQLFGNGAAAPHLVNVLIHIANSILVFRLFRQMTATLWRSAVLAMLFALHPLHVESVAWVAERKDVLSSFFGLLALLFYARYNDSSPGSHAWPYYLSLFFFTCSLMSKPMLVTLPFVLLLLDFWPLQRFNIFSLKRLLIEKIPFFLLSAAASVMTFLVQKKGGAVISLANVSMGQRVENTFVSYARYLRKIFWPVNLATPYPPPHYWPMWLVIFSIALFAVLCLAAVAARKIFPFAFTGWFWFAGMLVPVIGLVQVGAAALADRYAYLPLIGILLIAVWCAGEICAKFRVPRNGIILIATFFILACAVRAGNQVRLWKNDPALFGHALAVTKNNYVASLDLGFWYAKNGQVAESLQCYDDAVRLGPDNATALYDAADAFAKLGHWDDAIRDYRRSLQISPNQPDALNNLGFALARNKQLSEAAACFETVLALQPNSADAHNNLATILFMQGKLEDAATQFSDALQLSPNDFRICVNLAGTYEGLGQTNLAVKYYQQALRLQPDNQKIRAKLQSLGVPLSP